MSSLARRIQKRIFATKGISPVEVKRNGKVLTQTHGELNIAVTLLPLHPRQEFRHG